MKKNRFFAKGLLALSVALAGAAWADYTIVDLGRLDGSLAPGIAPAAINNNEVVVGTITTASGATHGASYDGSQMIDISQYIGGYIISRVADISDAGNMTGVYGGSNTTLRSFVVSNGVGTLLGTLGGATAHAAGVNDAGQVVGTSALSTPNVEHAFLYSGGSMTDLGTLGGTISVATGINNYGVVAGYSHITGNSEIHAFTYSNGVKTDLGTLGGFYSAAQAINDSRQVVGDSILVENSARHAFLYENGIMIDLGTLGGDWSAAFAINNNGDIVGDSNTVVGALNNSPFLYSNGVMTDLNLLLPANSGWVLEAARGINDKGQIVGWGKLNGERHGYLMAPGC